MKTYLQYLMSESLDKLPDYLPDEAEQTRIQAALRDMVEEDGVGIQALIDYFKPVIRTIRERLAGLPDAGISRPRFFDYIDDVLNEKEADKWPRQALGKFRYMAERLQGRITAWLTTVTMYNNDNDLQEHQWVALHTLQVAEFLLRPDIQTAFQQAARNSLSKQGG